jgi:putative glutamine amidotransferase
MKKLIGLTGPSVFSGNCIKMIENYFNFNFVVLPHENRENINFWLNTCDGFIIAGGVDIHPSLYGENVHGGISLSKFDFMRDMRELYIIDKVLEMKKPLLAICRGHQLLSIVLGLGREFCMDLNNCSTVHQPGARSITASEVDTMHVVNIIDPADFPMECVEERKVIAEVLGEEDKTKIWVNSFHHQAIFYLNGKSNNHYTEKNIKVIGTSTADWDKKRLLIELMTGENWVSVQWHPEYDYESNTPSRTVLNMYKKLFENDKRQ